jgi:putative FmdB family regulatory protein
MPLYDFECIENHRFERSVKLIDFEVPQFCSCGAPASRAISAPRFSVDNVGYDCPVTGKWIGSKREHEENLKQQGCRVLETGEKEANERSRVKDEAAFEKKLEDSIERQIDQMSSTKKEQLANELINGKADLAVERN